MMEVTVTKDNFEKEVLQSPIPVLVDFWAVWCGPCQMVAPVLSEIAREQAGRVKVCKINVDEEVELAARFGVMSIPTLLVFRDGRQTASAIGYRPKEEIESLFA